MDLYVVLGLPPAASPADIKRAYRRLSRRFHPGINPGDRAAEEMYQRISQAYETLIDPERRRAYDAAGIPTTAAAAPAFEFTGFDFSVSALGAQAATFTELFAEVLHPIGRSGQAPEVGADLHATVTMSFEDAMRGVERQIVVTRYVECPGCRGSGHVRGADAGCTACQGTGTTRWARGHMVFTKRCPGCQGTGRIVSERCARCGGHGRQACGEAVSVRVPAGVHDGARIRFPERGHAGRNGGSAGDLYVTVEVSPHPVFRREGDDIHLVLPVGVHEAVLGARIEVPSPDGPIKLRIPPGTNAGQRLRVRERGAPNVAGGRGDLIVEVQIVLPTHLDDRARELIREFGRLYPGTLRTF